MKAYFANAYQQQDNSFKVLLKTLAIEEKTKVTISIGISTSCHNKPAQAEQMIKSADLALYTAKERGRNRVETDD